MHCLNVKKLVINDILISVIFLFLAPCVLKAGLWNSHHTLQLKLMERSLDSDSSASSLMTGVFLIYFLESTFIICNLAKQDTSVIHHPSCCSLLSLSISRVVRFTSRHWHRFILFSDINSVRCFEWASVLNQEVGPEQWRLFPTNADNNKKCLRFPITDVISQYPALETKKTNMFSFKQKSF